MEVKFTIIDSYKTNLTNSIQFLQRYQLNELSEDIRTACTLDGTACELGFMLIAEKKLGIDIYENKRKKTKNINAIIKNIEEKLEKTSLYIDSTTYTLNDVQIRKNVLAREYKRILKLYNDLKHGNGAFDDEKAIEDLMAVFTFINMLLPVEYCIPNIIEGQDLINTYRYLTRSYRTLASITLRQEIYEYDLWDAGQCSPEGTKICDGCGHESLQLFSDNRFLFYSCSLCVNNKYFFECMRCASQCELNVETGWELDDDSIICKVCVDNISKD